MSYDPAEALRSLQGCRLRHRALRLTTDLGLAFPHDLGTLTGSGTWRINGVMFGAPPYYADDLALVPLGLVQVGESKNGAYFEVTNAGRAALAAYEAREGARVPLL